MTVNLHKESDHDLFVRLKQGDQLAFEEIYLRYWGGLFRAAYKRLPEKEKCQDLIQNVFLSLWSRRETLEIKNLQAYLFAAVRLQVLKYWSRNSKSNFLSETFQENLVSPLQSDTQVIEKEAKLIIAYFIAALPRKRKEIFVKYYFEGLNTAKIAIELKISQKTVQNQLNNAAQALRLKLTHIIIFLIIFLLSR